MQYIAFDSHKHYTQTRVENTAGNPIREARIMHERGTIREFLTQYEPGSSVAVETVGNWYWIVDEIEAAGCAPKLEHAHKAELMMGMIHKTDKLDAQGLNRLQRAGTLPEGWIPRGALRDQPIGRHSGGGWRWTTFRRPRLSRFLHRDNAARACQRWQNALWSAPP